MVLGTRPKKDSAVAPKRTYKRGKPGRFASNGTTPSNAPLARSAAVAPHCVRGSVARRCGLVVSGLPASTPLFTPG
jgi:hypothetical protein